MNGRVQTGDVVGERPRDGRVRFGYHGRVRAEGSEAVVPREPPRELVREPDADSLPEVRDVPASLGLGLVFFDAVAVAFPASSAVPVPVSPVPVPVSPVHVPVPAPVPEHPQQLLTDVPRELHPAVVQTVLLAKPPPVPSARPRLVRPQQHDVIAHLRLVRARDRRWPVPVSTVSTLTLTLTLTLPTARTTHEHALHAQHRGDGSHLFDDAASPRLEHRPRELRLHGERRHLASHLRDLAVDVDRAEDVQLSQRVRHRGPVGLVEKVEIQHGQAFYPQHLEVQHDAHERRPLRGVPKKRTRLNLRHGDDRHVVLERVSRVQTETPPGLRPPSASRALTRLHRAHGCDLQRVAPRLRVVYVLLHHAWIHDENHAGHRERRLRDVRRDDDAAARTRRRAEHPRLRLGRQRGVQRKDLRVVALRLVRVSHALVKPLTRALDLFLAGEKQQDIPGALAPVQVPRRLDRRLQVRPRAFARVRDVDREDATGDVVHRAVAEVGAEGRGSVVRSDVGVAFKGVSQLELKGVEGGH
eukprot:31468-Pelagococcus_subviridis.AAC.12